MNRFVSRLAVMALLASATTATAHEVWLEPETWAVTPGQPLRARIINGEFFEGTELIWHSPSVIRAERWDASGMQPITGRVGDRPALATDAPQDGLVTLLYQSGLNTVVYDDFGKFESFVTEKGHAAVLDQHAARRLPETPLTEAYARFAKTLVAVGSGQGADAPRGLEIEIVALTNPYTAPAADPLRFQVIYQGAPLAGNRVTVFAEPEGGPVTVTELVSDAEGTVALAAVPGVTYMVDAVMLREPSRDVVVATQGAVWESLWASLTFRAPDR